MIRYKPLEEYGIVGNLETCALVSDVGAVDWCCFPRLESPGVFAGLLGAVPGHFTGPTRGRVRGKQTYHDRTNVLRTTFETPTGTATVTDFMPVFETKTCEY